MYIRQLFAVAFILFSTIIADASYDGRLADDPYHKSSIWLYFIVLIAISSGVIAITKRQRPLKSKTDKQTKIKAKVYQEYGKYWDECPECNGRKWIYGTEISYLVAPPEKVCCSHCKGYGHELTSEAEYLHIEYCKQYEVEQTYSRNMRIQKEKEDAETKKKLSEKSLQSKHQAIAEIKAAGRRILKENEYLKIIDELRAKRKESSKKIMTMLESEPICTSCQNGSPSKNCAICRGSGHIPTPEANKQINLLEELSVTIKQLRSDYQALYPQDSSSRIHSASINNSVSLPSGVDSSESTYIRNKILKLVKNEPCCSHCLSAGYINVIMDTTTKRAYEQVTCPRCKGQGRIFYND